MRCLNPDWSRGAVDLWCGDAGELVDKVGEADCLLTDPPYSSGARRDADRQVRGSMLFGADRDDDWFSHDTMTTWGFTWFLRSVLVAAQRILVQGAHVYIFSDWRQTPNVYAICESVGLRVNHCLVWRKRYYGLGSYWRNQHENIIFASVGKPADMRDRGRGSVLDSASVVGASKVHPTEKPVDLLRQIVSAVPGERIVDPFMGSASVGEACVLEGRGFVGIEIEPRYFDRARERMSGLLFA